MTGYFILVANQSRARTFSREQKFSELEELESYDYPKGRKHVREIVTDKPGQAFASVGSGKDSMADPEDIKDAEARRFASTLADVLARKRRAYEGLIVIAAPAFLGKLRRTVNGATGKAVVLSIDKDLVKADPQQIRNEIDSAWRQ